MEIEDLALEEFDNDSFRIFKERGLENKRLSPNDITLTKEELMNKLNLIRNGKITYAGMLMFYQKPEKFVPGSFVKIGYFDERNELVYHDEIKGLWLNRQKMLSM